LVLLRDARGGPDSPGFSLRLRLAQHRHFLRLENLAGPERGKHDRDRASQCSCPGVADLTPIDFESAHRVRPRTELRGQFVPPRGEIGRGPSLATRTIPPDLDPDGAESGPQRGTHDRAFHPRPDRGICPGPAPHQGDKRRGSEVSATLPRLSKSTSNRQIAPSTCSRQPPPSVRSPRRKMTRLPGNESAPSS